MDYQAFGFEVLKHRRDKGLSQAELADLSGLSRNYVSMIERGAAKGVSVEVVVKLAQALNANPLYLLKALVGEWWKQEK